MPSFAIWVIACLLSVSATAAPTFTLILGQPTDRSVTVGLRSDTAVEAYLEYGLKTAVYNAQTGPITLPADPYATGFFASQILVNNLQPDARYFYRLRYRPAGSTTAFSADPESSFHTQRPPGSTFVFGVQGDSHPEREKTMFNSALYTQTLRAMAAEQPDFYITNGDDFSVDTLPTPYTQAAVTGRYTLQLPYFDNLARSAALFLGTGNHEETSLSNYNLPADSANSNRVPIWAQNARNLYYPSPGPYDANTGTFYSGNATVLPGIGVLRDYYAWQWGDALFVVIDPYWSSPAQVDTGLGGQNGGGTRTPDKWSITHGDPQYQWLKQTLEQSTAKWKFIFAHHVLGTGRGGVDIADQFEWGGKNANGTIGFPTNRPTWTLPIHQLMVVNKVTIFFQAHDHLFAREERDGVVYQSLPNPADNTYTAFNADAYPTGTVFPNSGYTKVTVGPSAVKVDYIRQWLPSDERPPAQVSGATQFSYTINAPTPAPAITSVNTAGGGATIAPNTWIEIKGSNLATTTRIWRTSDFINGQLPTTLDRVSVLVNGKPAYIYYVSPTQVNVLTPTDALPPSAQVQVSAATFSAPAAALAPALFTFSGTPYVAAVHANGALIGPTTLYPGTSTPAQLGETIQIYGNGFTVPPGALMALPSITIGNIPAVVTFAGLVAPGEYQFNVVIPPNAPAGDLLLTVHFGGLSTPSGTLVSIRN